MQIVDQIHNLRNILQVQRMSGKTIGFVPTMGYLHEGHLHLVEQARRQNEIVVASIFVNPLQFGPTEDLAAYPRDLERDARMLDEANCDVLFAPTVSEMYPEPIATTVEVAELGSVLCGVTRPTHFRGVTTVVCKLLNIVQPTRAYFGQKDAQQLILIRRMVSDLNIPTEIVGVSIVRESDGLAKSSRNVYLDTEARQHATILSQALFKAQEKIIQGERDAKKITDFIRATITGEPGVRIDYVEAVHRQTLQPMDTLAGPILIAVAAFVGKARLIDNIFLDIEI